MENLYTQRNILTFYVLLYYVGSMQLLLKFILIHNALQHAIIIKIHCHTHLSFYYSNSLSLSF